MFNCREEMLLLEKRKLERFMKQEGDNDEDIDLFRMFNSRPASNKKLFLRSLGGRSG